MLHMLIFLCMESNVMFGSTSICMDDISISACLATHSVFSYFSLLLKFCVCVVGFSLLRVLHVCELCSLI